MIKIEKEETVGWEAAIRGIRNSMNSRGKSGSYFDTLEIEENETGKFFDCPVAKIGKDDLNLMKRFRKVGTDHRKYLRMITVYMDITAPMYWWEEYDTYKVGTVANSCSVMYKITDKEFTLDDFSHEHLTPSSLAFFKDSIYELNFWRDMYLGFHDDANVKKKIVQSDEPMDKKDCWYQIIQILPSSYNQKRTVTLNYEVLANMYKSRKNHCLDEWRDFCKWIETLPYSELITSEVEE